MVDEVHSGRQQARVRLDEALLRPLDAQEAEEWDRERWGASPAALAEQEAQEAWLDEFTVE